MDLTFTARNIVNQLGDMFMETTEPETPERVEFVKFRQQYNDVMDDFVLGLLKSVHSDAIEEKNT